MKKILAVSLLLITIPCFSQKVKKPIEPIKIFEEYEKLYSDELYDDAYAKLDDIDRNDTTYSITLLEKSQLLIKKERYEEAIEQCKIGLALEDKFEYKFYVNLIVAYNRFKKHDDAMKVANEAIVKYPKNYLLFFNRASVFYSLKKYAEALSDYKKSIQLNPYYAASHLELGLLAADEGKVSQAVLAFNMFLTIEPNTKRANRVLARLNEIVSSKYEREPKNLQLSPEGGDDFSELDIILTNYAALAKGFKVPVKSQLPLIKQNYALFSKLTVDKDDNGFWMQTYVPFFKSLYDQGHFSGYSYYILQASENDEHKDLVKKNMPVIEKFIAWAVPNIDKTYAFQYEMVNGKNQKLYHWFSSNNHTLFRIGTLNETTQKINGYCEYFYSSGRMLSKGNYNSDGEKEGSWTFYYESGNKEEEAVFKNGKIEGKMNYYGENGRLLMEVNYLNEKIEGEKRVYNSSGNLTKKYLLKAGLMEGLQIDYYRIGEKYPETKANYSNDDVKDTVWGYYDNGALHFIKIYANKDFNGPYKSYFRNGKQDIDATFLNGIYNGAYKEYYKNGKLYLEGTYSNGKEIGNWKTYNAQGILTEESIYDEKGKRTGIYKNYDTDGKLICEMDYKSGEVVGYKYFDKQGGILKEAKKQKGEFDFIGFYPNGLKRFEGIYTSEGKKGVWKYYDEYGNLSSEENYNKFGLLEGTVKNFYNRGQLKSSFNYANNELDGLSISYHINGQIEGEGWYMNGKAQGYFYSYYQNGEVESIEYYQENELSGFQVYYNVEGKIEKEEFIKNGKLEKVVYFDSLKVVNSTTKFNNGTGTYTLTYPSGKKKYQGDYIEGAAHGEFVWYYQNGTPTTVGTYHNDKKNGTWKWYYDTNVLEIEGNYVYGNADGKWTYYYKTGKPERVEHYDEGAKTGEWIWYHENGQVEIRKKFLNNVEEGDATYYASTGEIQMVRKYREGVPVAYTYADATGKLKTPIELKETSYTVVCYYSNGNKSREYSVDKGVFHGVYNEYYPNGQLAEISNYKDDDLFGENKSFFPDGKLKVVGNFIENGIKDGKYTTYFQNGKIEKELVYKLGQLHGTCTYFDVTGKLLKKCIYYSGDLLKEENY